MSLNYSVTEISCTEKTKGGLKLATASDVGMPLDWSELLEEHALGCNTDIFELGIEEIEDPDSGMIFENATYHYCGDAATLARLFSDEGMQPADIQAAIDNAGKDLHAILVAKTALPEVALPGPYQTISKSARQLGQLIAKRLSHFMRGGNVVKLIRDDSGGVSIKEVKAVELRSGFEKVATLVKPIETPEGNVGRQMICSDSQATAILASEDFLVSLPKLNLVTNCPVLIEQRGELRVISGYDSPTGIFACGIPVEEIDAHEAIELLSDLVSEFAFITPSDRSRALAAFITPALVMGGLLPGRAALDLGEADQSQSGKGFRHRLTAAIYRDLVHAIAGSTKGVGSLEETFDTKLVEGRAFISLDNVRGKINSQKLESFLTEDTYSARTPYSRAMAIDPRRVCVMLTSNKAELTDDLAKRCSCVRIEKQPDNFQFRTYPEGTILDHARAHQPRYLGAVFAVIRAWHNAGKPSTNDSRHDFRVWAGTLDWIVRHIFGAAPLLDGHRETQERMTSPALTWLRDMALEITRQGRASEWLNASNILELADAADLEIPGLRPAANLEDETTRRTCLQQIGKRLSRCFGAEFLREVDGLCIERQGYQDEQGRDRYRYMVYRSGEDPGHAAF